MALSQHSRYITYAICTGVFVSVQHRRWKHAQLMKRHGGFNTIGYQIPGGLFVANIPPESSSTKLTPEELVKGRWYIDLKCQVYKRDERLSSFDPTPFWFDVEFTKTVSAQQDQAKS